MKSAKRSTEKVDHTTRDTEEGSAKEDLERLDASEESVTSSKTTIDVETIRSAQMTMMTHMVRHADDVVVRATGHALVEDARNA